MPSEFPTRTFRVKAGRVLHFPEGILNGDTGRAWVLSGGVVDLGDPLVNALAAGQRFKLDDEPGVSPTWTEDSAPLPIRRHLEVERAKRAEAKQKKAAEAVPVAVSATPEAKPPTQTRRTRRRSTQPEDAPTAPMFSKPASRASDVEAAIDEGGDS